MKKTIVLAVDTSSHVSAAAAMTRELARDSGDNVIVLHVHEFATGRWGRMQVDCHEGAGEGVVSEIVADLKATGIMPTARSGRLSSGTSPGTSWMPRTSMTRGWWSWALAGARTCRIFRSAASRTGCCIRPPGQC